MREIPDYFYYLEDKRTDHDRRRKIAEDQPKKVELLEVDNRTIAFATYGPEDGNPTFLIPGNPSSRLGPVPRSLVLHHINSRVITMDLPGFGKSDRDPDASISDIAEKSIIPIADDLGIEKFGILGRSAGVPIALALGAKYPERVKKAAALAGLAPDDAEIDWTYGMSDVNQQAHQTNQTRQELLQKFSPVAEHVQQDRRYFLEKFLWPQLSDADRSIINELDLYKLLTDSWAEALSSGVKGWVDAIQRLHRPWGFNVADVSVPILVWHGNDDNFSDKSHSRWLADMLPNAHTSLFNPNKGHFNAFDITVDVLVWLHQQNK